ncbi:hypothetical protein PSMEN_08965 [Ectopseudomonas mendocina]|nr:hypothetical protein PSMEN_08965 [Pseudomonas mendocina]
MFRKHTQVVVDADTIYFETEISTCKIKLIKNFDANIKTFLEVAPRLVHPTDIKRRPDINEVFSKIIFPRRWGLKFFAIE